jgi:hypothetical protein
MKTQFEVSINYNDLFKNESILQIISSLEKLEEITDEVFERINKNLLEKKGKLENLKSRINRANNIIASFETLPQALTIKSKRFYPNISQEGSDGTARYPLYKSIFYDDVCDFKLLKNVPGITKKSNELNTKPSNSSNFLGKKPDGNLEDVSLTQEILNSLEPFKEITSDLTLRKNVNKLFNTNEIPPVAQRCYSVFQFIDKVKVFGEKIKASPSEGGVRESNLLNTFMNKKTPKANVKKPQEAPVSIIEKAKLTQFKQKRELIRRNTNIQVELNIPKNINLGFISEFDVDNAPIEDYFAEEHAGEIYAPQGTIYGDDINEFQLPLDIIKNYKKKTSVGEIQITNGNTTQISNAPLSNEIPVSNNVAYSSSNVQPINNNNQPTTGNNQLNSNNNKTTVVTNPVISNNPPISVPQGPTSKVPNIPNPPKIPLPPKLPPIIKQASEGQPKIQEKPKPQPVVTSTPAASTGSFLDEIGDNPMSRLKKIGTVKVSSSKVNGSSIF